MTTAIFTISALLLAVFGMNVGFGLQATLLGVRAGIEGFTLVLTGAIMAAYFLGYIGGSVYGPRLIERVGHIRTFAALASIASAATLAHSVFVEPWTWMVLRALTGFCLAGMLIVSESWLNHASNNTNRGSMLATYMIVTLGAAAAGQMLLNAASPSGSSLFILVSVLVSLSLVPVTVSRRDVPPPKQTKPMPIAQLFSLSPTGVVGCLSTGLINGSFWSMGAVYAFNSGMTNERIAMFMALVVVGGMTTQWPVGRLSDRIDRRIVMIGISIAIALSAVALSIFGEMETSMRLIAGVVFGMAVFPLYAIVVAHVNDVVDTEDFVPASSMLLITYGVGAMVGPLLASAAMTRFGPGGLFYYIAVVAVMLCVFAIHRLWVGQAISTEDKESYVAMPKTSPVVITMAVESNGNEDSKS